MPLARLFGPRFELENDRIRSSGRPNQSVVIKIVYILAVHDNLICLTEGDKAPTSLSSTQDILYK